ncbi:predicted protein [Thalassiosira pseudonana CCMP1335]|uniref:Peptidase M12B domain-containing protein n=1 Tax=Thalassiosira pseudonana TaxID=35128 RepID=B8BUR0_THAPS|nr:predicted protein [Thalassiosira pseudonana CCMP1335]EED95328.1 predicted protein [Thalassiosira pseudonana CCMP1335]
MMHKSLHIKFLVLCVLVVLYFPNASTAVPTNRRRLRPSDNIIQYLENERVRGKLRPRFTLVGKIPQGDVGPVEFASDESDYDIDVVVANPSVTRSTTYSVRGGRSQPVRPPTVKYLVSDPNSAIGAGIPFALLAVDESTNKVSGIVQKNNEEMMKVEQTQGGALTFTPEEKFVAEPWYCGVTSDFLRNGGEVYSFKPSTADHRRAEDDNRHAHTHHTQHHEHHQSYSKLLRGGDIITYDFDTIAGELGDIDIIKSRHRKLYATDSFPQLYTYQVDLYIEIDDTVVANNNNSLDQAIAYVDAVITLVSSILQREADTHLHVAHIEVSNIYANAADKESVLELMKTTYGGDEWHWADGNGIDIHHALLGQDFGGGMAFVSSVCRPDSGFGFSSRLRCNIANISAECAWDLYIISHEIGHSLGSKHSHDNTGYDPVVDTCGLDQCSDELPLKGSATIMSYCNQCTGNVDNVATTYGGYWYEDDRNDIANWKNSLLNGTVSFDSKRVPKTMWEFVSSQTGECSNALVDDCCGNGVCEANEAECDEDCGPFTLETPLCSSCTLANGVMFDVTTLSSIVVGGLEFRHSSADVGVYDVTVYTAPGSYVDKISSQEEWSTLAELTVEVTESAFGEYFLASFPEIDLDANASQAFYVASSGLQLALKLDDGDNPYTVDDNMQILNPGRAVSANHFGPGANGYFWNGRITYRLPVPLASPTNSPTIKATSTEPSSSPSVSLAPSDLASPRPSVSLIPTSYDSEQPSSSHTPTSSDSTSPSVSPSSQPSVSSFPTGTVSSQPSASSSELPSSLPTQSNTNTPSLSQEPSQQQTQQPSISSSPTITMTTQPSASSSDQPSSSSEPSTSSPTQSESTAPSSSLSPTATVSSQPSASSSEHPSASSEPTSLPPTQANTASPSLSSIPTPVISEQPSVSIAPTQLDSNTPSLSIKPTPVSSSFPSMTSNPSDNLSQLPSLSSFPTGNPTSSPTEIATTLPSRAPSTSNSPSSMHVWFMRWDLLKCRLDCVGEYPCGGTKEFWNDEYASAEECCNSNLSTSPELVERCLAVHKRAIFS